MTIEYTHKENLFQRYKGITEEIKNFPHSCSLMTLLQQQPLLAISGEFRVYESIFVCIHNMHMYYILCLFWHISMYYYIP